MDIPNVIGKDAVETIEDITGGRAEETAIIAEHVSAIKQGEDFQGACDSEIKSITKLANKFA